LLRTDPQLALIKARQMVQDAIPYCAQEPSARAQSVETLLDIANRTSVLKKVSLEACDSALLAASPDPVPPTAFLPCWGEPYVVPFVQSAILPPLSARRPFWPLARPRRPRLRRVTAAHAVPHSSKQPVHVDVFGMGVQTAYGTGLALSISAETVGVLNAGIWFGLADAAGKRKRAVVEKLFDMSHGDLFPRYDFFEGLTPVRPLLVEEIRVLREREGAN
jgi:hypothetical protein